MATIQIYGFPPDPVPFDWSTFDPCYFPEDDEDEKQTLIVQTADEDSDEEEGCDIPRTFSLESPETIEGVVIADLTFNSEKRIHDGNSMVYRGILSGWGPGDLRVVCKLLTNERGIKRARREATMYQTKLLDLQGHCVPRFHGLWTGIVRSHPAACLVLEDRGETVGDFHNINFTWRSVCSSLPWCCSV